MQTAALLKPEQPVSELTLKPGHLHIGSAQDNDIIIKDNAVSSYHAKIITYFHQSVVIDLSSETGTFLNGERVIKQTLNDHDILQLGNYTLKIRTLPVI